MQRKAKREELKVVVLSRLLLQLIALTFRFSLFIFHFSFLIPLAVFTEATNMAISSLQAD